MDHSWREQYSVWVPATFEPECQTAVQLFERGDRVAAPASPAICHFDAAIGRTEAREMARALAAGLQRRLGLEPGARVAVMLQNLPQLPIAFHAIWLAGGVVTPVNPMYKRKELAHQLRDSGATAIICADSLEEVVASVRAETGLEHVVLSSELDIAIGPTSRPGGSDSFGDTVSLVELLASGAELSLVPASPDPQDAALLTYTSGTTGVSKGAINTHANLAHNAEMLARWFALERDDVAMAMSPMFHITGIVCQLAVSAFAGMPLVLFDRFDAGEMLRLVERWRATWSIGPLTAYIALLEHPDFGSRDISSLTKVASGGAPVSPAVAERWREETGSLLLNAYGLTEATAPAILTPVGVQAPVDPDSGALSIGVPVSNTEVKVVSDDGSESEAMEIGEIWIKGPQIMPGYWQRPEESSEALSEGWLRTGDVGRRDQAGWFFLLDRLKDMIIASGYKVWPRDVEDALYGHPAVREASVIGVPDDYRGEAVRAYVSLKAGQEVDAEALIAHCRAQLAVYKAPREVEIVAEIPKTLTGKALRRELRAQALDRMTDECT